MSSPEVRELLPDEGQTLLLRACLLGGQPAVEAWAEWRSRNPDPLAGLRAASSEIGLLLPLLAHQLDAAGVEIEEGELSVTLRGAGLREKRRAEILHRGAGAALGALDEAGIEVTVVGGVEFAERAWPRPDLRHTHDLDLLVAESEIGTAAAVLRQPRRRRPRRAGPAGRPQAHPARGGAGVPPHDPLRLPRPDPAARGDLGPLRAGANRRGPGPGTRPRRRAPAGDRPGDLRAPGPEMGARRLVCGERRADRLGAAGGHRRALSSRGRHPGGARLPGAGSRTRGSGQRPRAAGGGRRRAPTPPSATSSPWRGCGRGGSADGDRTRGRCRGPASRWRAAPPATCASASPSAGTEP